MTPQEEKNYFAVHAWLRKNHGVANKCESESCTKKSENFEWALVKGFSYEKKVENFKMLCVSCHRKYDVTDEARIKMSKSAKIRIGIVGNPMKKDDNKKKASEWMRDRIVSVETRNKMSASRLGKRLPGVRRLKRFGESNPASRKVVDNSSGQLFDTVKAAAIFLNTKRTTLTMMLNGKNKNKTTMCYYEQP